MSPGHGHSASEPGDGTRSKAEALAERGARIAAAPADAVKGASVVLSMLGDDNASREVWTGAQGALAAAAPTTVLVESSTVSPRWIMELAKNAGVSGLDFLDAPVTGSRTQAKDGQLTFLVGGSEQALAKVAPGLESMSKEIVHLGPVGSGAKMKLINNFLCACRPPRSQRLWRGSSRAGSTGTRRWIS